MGKIIAIIILVACCIMGFEYVGEYKPERCSVEGCRQRRALGRDICTDHLHGYLPMPEEKTTEKPVVKTTVTTTTEATTEVTTCEVGFDSELSTEEQKKYPDNIERRVAAEKATETTTYHYHNYHNYYKDYSYYFNEPEPDMGKVHEFYEEHKSEFRCFEDAYEAYEDDLDYWEDYYD